MMQVEARGWRPKQSEGLRDKAPSKKNINKLELDFSPVFFIKYKVTFQERFCFCRIKIKASPVRQKIAFAEKWTIYSTI